jgi:ABC-type lipoprotein release transport system permease subunit
MALVPFSYNTRSLFVRRSSTILTVLGIGATVAVLAGVLALQQGFVALFTQNGREDVIVFLRQSSTNEGDSIFTRERAEILMKSLPEFAEDAGGQRVCTAESFCAVRRPKADGGGETNVPVRGVRPMTFTVIGEDLRIVAGRNLKPGTDEVIVGHKLVDRIQDCRLDDVIQFNMTPFRVVGIFEYDGPYSSEIWGDRERIAEALEQPVLNRVIGRLKPGTDVEELASRMMNDPQVPCKVMTEREYLASQTERLSVVLGFVGVILAAIMGVAAVFTATNTMLAALAARTNEIGILLALGFRPIAIFTSFLFEALLLGLIGGGIGCLLALPLNGVDTGTTNFQTFTEVAFAFKITPFVLITAVLFSLILGLFGGAWPALRAATMPPTQAMRRE